MFKIIYMNFGFKGLHQPQLTENMNDSCKCNFYVIIT
jgi:hypothetical protein